MLGSGFKAERLRVNLRLVINRLKLLEKKKSKRGEAASPAPSASQGLPPPWGGVTRLAPPDQGKGSLALKAKWGSRPGESQRQVLGPEQINPWLSSSLFYS